MKSQRCGGGSALSGLAAPGNRWKPFVGLKRPLRDLKCQTAGGDAIQQQNITDQINPFQCNVFYWHYCVFTYNIVKALYTKQVDIYQDIMKKQICNICTVFVLIKAAGCTYTVVLSPSVEIAFSGWVWVLPQIKPCSEGGPLSWALRIVTTFGPAKNTNGFAS